MQYKWCEKLVILTEGLERLIMYACIEQRHYENVKTKNENDNENIKIFLRRIPLSRFLAKTLKVMMFSFLQRRCHPLTRCIKKIADQPCYNVIFYLRRTEHKY